MGAGSSWASTSPSGSLPPGRSGRFVEALESFGSGEWSDVYRLAEAPSQISVRRPFYPYRPGGTSRSHLLEGLGLDHDSQLLRRCERGSSTRNAPH